jgi:hypothetical protein
MSDPPEFDYFAPGIVEGQVIWVKVRGEGYVEARVTDVQRSPKRKTSISVEFLEGRRTSEVLTLPVDLITYSLTPPELPGVSGDIEKCNDLYSLKQLQGIARDNNIPFAGLNKLELCRALVKAGLVE